MSAIFFFFFLLAPGALFIYHNTRTVTAELMPFTWDGEWSPGELKPLKGEFRAERDFGIFFLLVATEEPFR